MRRTLTTFRTLVAAAILMAAFGASSGSFAQQTRDGLNPTGQNPTAESVNEDFLFKQDPKITGRISIPTARRRT